MALRALKKFIDHEASGGVILITAAILALAIDNSPLAYLYDALLSTPMVVEIGALMIDKPLLLWINDGLMAVFFLLVGLEIKREFLEGQLAERDQIILPGLAAIGGMMVPALVFTYFNWNDPVAINGWAIPAATDIAFALGVLALLGPRVPLSLKVFLLTVAILDDLGAIMIIALFYTANLSVASLAVAAVFAAILFLMNRLGVTRISPYVLVGIALWVCVLKSGVHATLAGVVIAMSIPMRDTHGNSPLKHMEHGLHPYIIYFIMPVFAFANAGVSLAGLTFASLLEPLPLGIALGLLVGKQVGIFGACLIAVKTGVARLPDGVNWFKIYGVACLCGIGFTMSLFIGSLSFSDPESAAGVRLGVLSGSLCSAVIGYIVLRIGLSVQTSSDAADEQPAGAKS